MVRRAFQVLPPVTESNFMGQGGDFRDGFGGRSSGHENGDGTFKRDPEDTAEFWESPERTEMDDKDPGGPEVLAKSTDKGSLRMRRSFELVLSTGRVIRFEVSFLDNPNSSMTNREEWGGKILDGILILLYMASRLILALTRWNGSLVFDRSFPTGENGTEWTLGSKWT